MCCPSIEYSMTVNIEDLHPYFRIYIQLYVQLSEVELEEPRCYCKSFISESMKVELILLLRLFGMAHCLASFNSTNEKRDNKKWN